jgi:hypothetical protein
MIPGPTLWIDDPEAGGSEPGAWADAIANTPSLAAACLPDPAPDQDPQAND